MSDPYDRNGIEDYSDILITRKHIHDFNKRNGLKKTLILEDLWGITVGLIISGLFFEWSLTLNYVKPLGMIVLIALISVFYMLYTNLLSKLVVSYPYAGGCYAYVRKAFGKFPGYLSGILKTGEFICITAVIFCYMDLYIKMMNFPFPDFIELGIFATLILIHTIGIKEASLLQLALTGVSISIFIMFVLGIHPAALPLHLETGFSENAAGMFAAVPFAFWMFLGIDITMLTVEETKNPDKHIPANFIVSLSVILLSLLGITLISLNSISFQLLTEGEFPLVRILEELQGEDKVLLPVFSFLSLSAFIAGLNGGITGYSRQVFALGRAGYLPPVLGSIYDKTKVPYLSVLSALVILLLSEFVDKMIMIKAACFFALLSYLFTTLSYLKLKLSDSETGKGRILHKASAGLVGMMCVVCLISMSAMNPEVLLTFFGLLAATGIYYRLVAGKRINNDAPEEVEANTDGINIIITNLIKD